MAPRRTPGPARWALVGNERVRLILQQSAPRRLAPGDPIARLARVYGDADAALMRAASAGGVPVPRVRLVLDSSDGLGGGYVTDRIEGETLGPRINRDERYAAAREKMAAQCGEILGAIHALDPARLPFLVEQGPDAQVALYRDIWDSFDHPHPAIEPRFPLGGGAPAAEHRHCRRSGRLPQRQLHRGA